MLITELLKVKSDLELKKVYIGTRASERTALALAQDLKDFGGFTENISTENGKRYAVTYKVFNKFKNNNEYGVGLLLDEILETYGNVLMSTLTNELAYFIGVAFGGWYDNENNEYELGLTVLYDDVDMAMQFANEKDERFIFDTLTEDELSVDEYMNERLSAKGVK